MCSHKDNKNTQTEQLRVQDLKKYLTNSIMNLLTDFCLSQMRLHEYGSLQYQEWLYHWKTYNATYRCGTSLTTKDGQLIPATTCQAKKRCIRCSNVSTAKMINSYSHHWEGKKLYNYCLTTIPTSFDTIIEDYLEYKHAHQLALKRIKRLGLNTNGSTSVEIQPSHKGGVRIHIHGMCESRETAELIVKNWVEIIQGKYDVKHSSLEVNLNSVQLQIKSPIENFKYITKYGLVKNGQMTFKNRKRQPVIVTGEQLHKIMSAMRGRNTVQFHGEWRLKSHKEYQPDITKYDHINGEYIHYSIDRSRRRDKSYRNENNHLLSDFRPEDHINEQGEYVKPKKSKSK